MPRTRQLTPAIPIAAIDRSPNCKIVARIAATPPKTKTLPTKVSPIRRVTIFHHQVSGVGGTSGGEGVSCNKQLVAQPVAVPPPHVGQIATTSGHVVAPQAAPITVATVAPPCVAAPKAPPLRVFQQSLKQSDHDKPSGSIRVIGLLPV